MKSIFDNCMVKAPDGILLSRCSHKRAQWYIDQGLATKVGEFPLAIQLNFEPSGRVGSGQPHIVEGKPNCCVACGSTEDLTKHHIVPWTYIRYASHAHQCDSLKDILPMCLECHRRYEVFAHERRLQLQEQYDVNVGHWRRIIVPKYAGTLYKHGDKIPEHKKEAMIAEMVKFFGTDQFTDEDLRRVSRQRFEKPSKLLMDKIEDYDQFAADWRAFFIQTMQPKYMPAYWSVERDMSEVWIPKNWFKRLPTSVQSL